MVYYVTTILVLVPFTYRFSFDVFFFFFYRNCCVVNSRSLRFKEFTPIGTATMTAFLFKLLLEEYPIL